MRIVLFLVFLSFSLSAEPLKIKIVGDDWGKAGKVDLLKVLQSAGNSIWKHCPDIKLPPIQVGNSKNSPISLLKESWQW